MSLKTSVTVLSDCRLLWEFIYQLLMNSKYSGYVNWESKEDYVFRIVNPTGTCATCITRATCYCEKLKKICTLCIEE